MNRRDFFKLSTSSVLVGSAPMLMAMPETNLDLYIQDQLSLDRNQCEGFAKEFLHKNPIIAARNEKLLLQSISLKLKQTQKLVGYGNFNLLSFDELLQISKNHPKIGAFSKEELDYIEKIFYTEASDYGFYGKKVTYSLSDTIKKNTTQKIPRTGHYLYKGEPQELYERLRREVGPSIVLTSGVRSVVKQLDLFIYKAHKTKGDFSEAAHSLAPPGYSFHGISDFDVGKVGLGYKNFTSSFAQTQEYKSLQKLGYISIRYPQDNPFGVRFEPWHIKV